MSLKFACPHCQSRLSAEPEHYSQQIDCPECTEAFIVPTPQDLGIPDNDENIIKFICPHCERKLSAVAHQHGKEMPCPFSDCLQPVLIPRPEWKPVPTTLLQSGSASTNQLLKQAEEITRKN